MAAPAHVGRRGRFHARRRTSHDAAIAVALCLAAIAAVLALPGLPPLAVLAAGFLAGAALERYRQAERARPLRLSETPSAWARGVRESVGLPYALGGVVAAAAAVAVLLLPSLRTGADERPAAPSRLDMSIDRRALPRVPVLKRAAGTAFAIKGASFRVFPLAAPRAAIGPARRPAGRGRTWLLVGVDCRNLSRARFRPSLIAYRLENDRGTSYWPDIGGGTGPASLGQTGFLKRGELFRTRLSFRVPRSSRRLTLVFEPVPDGSIHVEVPLRRR